MQNFIDHSIQNGVTLLDKGKCQCCGADYEGGIFECMKNFNNGLDLLDANDSTYHTPKFLRVDAHALQHPEIHGRWNNHFHLTRLHLILDQKVIWDYTKSPLLNNFLNVYKQSNPDEKFAPPQPQKRGSITLKDLSNAKTAAECVLRINQWADEVYQSWSPQHAVVSQIARDFLETGKVYKSNAYNITNR